MATGFLDFSTYTSASQPSDWTLATAATPTFTVEDDAAVTGGKKLVFTGDTRYCGVTYDVLNATADCEIVARVRADNDQNYGVGVGLLGRHSGGTLGISSYWCGLATFWDVANAYERSGFDATDNGGDVTVGFASLNNWFWVRQRIVGTTVDCWFWNDGDTPKTNTDTPDVTYTDTTYTSGSWGIHFDAGDGVTSVMEIDVFGYATAGEDAPISAPSGGTVTGPATATDGSATTITGTGLTGAASVSIGLSGSELAQTFGTVTDTTIAIADVESGWDDAVVGTPATAFPLEPTILAGGTTPYQLQIVVDAITPFNTTINPASGFQVLQTTIAAANTTVGESIFGSNIITVEDDMQARYPSVVSGVTVTIDSAGVPNLNGTELAAAGGSITFNTAYYSPLNGQVSVVTLTLTDGSVSVADPELSASDTMAQALRGLGFTGTLQDMQLQWLSSMGYTTGSLSDRWREMLDFEAIVDDGLNTRKLKFYESELLTSGKSFLETQKDYWASRI